MAVTGSTHLPARSGGAAQPLSARVRLGRRAARVSAGLSRHLRGGSGTVIGGRVLQAVAPQAVRDLASGRPVTLVSGTNGKTSITALTVAALGGTPAVDSNADGANTPAGIAGALATVRAPRLVLEVDEGWLRWAVHETAPEVVVLANLSRDQLSRHHEVGALASAWRAALAGVPTVVATADDPCVVWAALAARRQVWVGTGSRWTDDAHVCPACGEHCVTGPTGWGCAACGLHRPRPRWWVDDGQLLGAATPIPLHLQLPGQVNHTNAAFALAAAAAAARIPPDQAAARLAAVSSVAGRYERVRFRGHDLRLLLAKNPAGWLELLETLSGERHPIILVFNAEGVDGRDPSWLYDVSFTSLTGRRVMVQGRRATDLLVRLQHDGVAAEHVPGSVADAVWRLPAGPVDLVGNYTAFQGALREVRRG